MLSIGRKIAVVGVTLGFGVWAQGAAAQDALNFTKVFSPDTVGVTAGSVLTYTIQNSSATPNSDVQFTHALPSAPAQMTVAADSVSSTCGGIVTAATGDTAVSLTGGLVGAAQSCTISVPVQVNAAGTYSSTTSALLSSEGSSTAASADLTADAGRPSLSKSFSNSTPALNSVVTQTYTFDNSANAGAVNFLSLSERFPAGVTVATPANLVTDCTTFGTSFLTAAEGGQDFAMGGYTVGGNSSCSFSVDLLVETSGQIGLVSNQSFASTVSLGVAAGTLSVSAPASGEVSISKLFSGDPVLPGETVTLSFALRNLSRSETATDVAFSDDLDAMLSGATGGSFPSDPCGSGSVLSGTSTIALSGGTLAPGAECRFVIDVVVPGAAASGDYVNVTSGVSANIGGSPVVGSSVGQDTLSVLPAPATLPPVLTKTVLTNPVSPNGTISIRYSLYNPNAAVSLTGVEFVDNNSKVFDSGGVQLDVGFNSVAFAGQIAACGGNYVNITNRGLSSPPHPDFASPGIDFEGGTLAALDTCEFTVTYNVGANLASGSYQSISDPILASGPAALTGNSATGSFSYGSGDIELTISKLFAEDQVARGGTTNVTFTLRNGETAAATDISFTDPLESFFAGTTYDSTISNTCGFTIGGGSTISFTDGALAVNSQCEATVAVTLGNSGTGSVTATNTTSDLTAAMGALPAAVQSNTAASDSIEVVDVVPADPVSFEHSYLPDVIFPGEAFTLRYTLTNPHPSDAAAIGSFSHQLSTVLSGLSATGGASTNTCGGALTGASTLDYVGGSVPAAGSCVIEVPVLMPAGAAEATYNSVGSSLSYTRSGTFTGVVLETAVFEVRSQYLALSSSFAPTVVSPGNAAQLDFVLSNTNASQAASNVAFTSDFGAMAFGATSATVDAVVLNTCGGTVTGAGTGTLSASSISIPANGNCQISASFNVPADASSGAVSSTTSSISGTVGGFASSGPAATSVLDVTTVGTVLSQSFDGPALPEETAILSFTLTNPNAGAVSDLSFSHDLDAVLSGLTATVLPSAPCGASSAITGTGQLAFTGGELTGGGSCSFDVSVLVPAGAVPADYTSTTSDVSSSGQFSASAASATLTVSPYVDVSVSATDGVTSVSPSQTLVYTTVIANAGPSTDPAVAVSAPFPANMTCSSTSVAAGGATGNTAAGTGNLAETLSMPAGSSVTYTSSCLVGRDATGPFTYTATATPSVVDLNTGNESASETDTALVPLSLSFTKAFAPTAVDQGDVTTLTLTIDNTANLVASTGLNFNDPLTNGVTIAATPNAATTCSGGTLTAAAGGSSISYSGGTVPGGAVCTVSVDLVTTTSGTFNNVTSALTSDYVDATAATASLSIASVPLSLAASYSPDTIEQQQTSTLTLMLTNGAPVSATSIAVANTLPAGVTIASTPNASTTCTGGTLTAAAGTASLTYSGGSLAGAASCQIAVDVTSTTIGTYPDTIDSATSSLGTSAAASATLTVERATTGVVTFVQNTDIDGTFNFASAEAALSFSIATSGGTGSYGPVRLTEGVYLITHSAPAGLATTAMSCNDGNSSGDPSTGELTLSIDSLDDITCTISSVSSAQKASEVINDFLTKRADLLLSTEPDASRRFDRLNRGFGNASATRFATGDLQSLLPFSVQINQSAGSYLMSTSLHQMRQASAKMSLAHSPGTDELLVDNYRFDAWMEAEYKQFDYGTDGEGHFAVAYFGADYLVNEDLLVGAILQFDNMEDRSSANTSTARGKGWMFGPYMTARLGQNLYFDGRIATGSSNNSVSPFNTYVDSFNTQRLLASASLSGEFQQGAWTIRPNASFSYIQEKQQAYVDSLGATVPEQTVKLGQFKIGPTFTGQFMTDGGTAYAPYFGFDAIYNIDETSGVTLTSGGNANSDSWRGRVHGGVRFVTKEGTELSFGGSVDGLGQSGASAWGISFDVNMPF